jgi:hypothetical protein
VISREGRSYWGAGTGRAPRNIEFKSKSGAVEKRTARITALDVEKVADLQKRIHKKTKKGNRRC